MCYGCYAEAGKPKPTERSTAALPLITRVFEEDFMGGNLHCEIYDYNLEDIFFEDLYLKGWNEDEFPVTKAEQECYQYLKSLTEAERYAAVAEYDGYLSEG